MYSYNVKRSRHILLSEEFQGNASRLNNIIIYNIWIKDKKENNFVLYFSASKIEFKAYTRLSHFGEKYKYIIFFFLLYFTKREKSRIYKKVILLNYIYGREK